jgi:anti-anti-sigma factor
MEKGEPMDERRDDLTCRVEVTRVDGAIVVAVEGQLDAATVGDFEPPLLQAVESGENVIVDLRACSFIDSAVIAAIVLAKRCMKPAGASLRLVGGEVSQPLRALEIAGLEGQVAVFPTLTAAVRGGNGSGWKQASEGE